jgi:hypothetical protein
MATKSFTTYQPEEDQFIELPDFEKNIHTFKLNPSIPGQVILDFMDVTGTEDPKALAAAIKTVLALGIVEEDQAAWKEFILEARNGITVDVLSEVVGYVVAVLSGNPQDQE